MSEEPTERLNNENTFEARVLAEFAALNNRLTTLEEKVDSRLRETRPIWEAVLSRLDMIEAKLDAFAIQWLELRGEINLLKKRVPPAA
ncbi:MAG TPA: hypothetical protein VGX48_19110 [Pyrinomonadaceae bacterium]|jgi:tetrahydromethanopterin S-methyltransferase subunit G|nr:hypothetical protein [Pyrinomonadaceae bacterium]